MNLQSGRDFAVACRDFRKLHRRAVMHGLFNRLTGRPLTPCHFQSVSCPLQQGARQLQEICLADIRGSVGRARDYTANFLPRRPSDEERWARVRVAVDSDTGVAPLELFELDGAYYIRDGHHRVSVFNYLRVRCVEAYVVKLKALKPRQKPFPVSFLNPVTQGGC